MPGRPREAIAHAQGLRNVQIIVAINKIDQAERGTRKKVKRQLADRGLIGGVGGHDR